MQLMESQGIEKKFLEAQSWYEKNDFGEALKLLLELEAEGTKLPNVYFYLALLYHFKFNDTTKADSYYKKTLEIDPDFAPAYYNYASFLQNNNRFDELEKFLEQMQRKLPVAQADVYLEYGLMRESQLRYKEALRYYDLALQNGINPEFVQRIKDSRNRCLEKQRKHTFFGKLEARPLILSLILALAFLSIVMNMFLVDIN